ncbi:chromate transporter [bacterium]|nr:chromate transporter [bacterium]
MIYLLLFFEYFKTGLFAFGGGYATLPFLYHISEVYGWYSAKQLSDMLAVSSITPGPVGVNVATFSGYVTSGLLGAFVATSAVVLPSLILVVIVAKLLAKFRENKYVQAAIHALKPAGCGLLAGVAINLFRENVINPGTFILFIMLLIMSIRVKKDPLIYLGVSALAGLILGVFHLV